jgi:pilus assembly protein Flp/PilA
VSGFKVRSVYHSFEDGSGGVGEKGNRGDSLFPFLFPLVNLLGCFHRLYYTIEAELNLQHSTWNFQPSKRKEVSGMLPVQPDSGQSLVEYALIIMLTAIIVIVIMVLLGPAISNMFSNVVANL